MAQNHLKSGFPSTAQGRSFPTGSEAGGFSVLLLDGFFPQIYFTVGFRCVELEAQLLNQSNAFLYNTYLLSWSGFFNPAVVLSASETLSFQTKYLH